MRILLHDYTGHAFQADLARQLARLGHEVLHASCASFPAPKGCLARRDDDAPGLTFTTLRMARGFAKYSFVRRWQQERAYARPLNALIDDWRPDLLLICNTPLDPLVAALAHCRRQGIARVFWIQDLYSLAIRRYLGDRWLGLGKAVALRYARAEARATHLANARIVISESFLPTLRAWGHPPEAATVQPNWAPLADHPWLPQGNEWARRHGLAGRTVLLYAGTLGLKHDAGLLHDLAAAMANRPEVAVVVVSEGPAAEALRARARASGLAGLIVLPYQPVDQVATMLASARVHLTLLESGAGVFSVPSKLLGQLCAGRAQLASMPGENDAARMIEAADCGRVVAPGDRAGWLAAAQALVDDPGLCEALGRRARGFAEARFDSQAIARRFEAVLVEALGAERLRLEAA